MCMACFDGVMRPSVRRPLYYSSYILLCTHQNISGKNYYDILGVKRGASIAEIKSAFYKLSKKYHPDALVKSGDPTIYLEIKDAYEVLKDKKKRRDYDLGLINTFNSHRIYARYNEATGESHKKCSSSNFYARTPQYDNDKWYEWYRKRRMDEMETRWIRKNTGDYWTKTILSFSVMSFIFSMIIRIRTEHCSNKADALFNGFKITFVRKKKQNCCGYFCSKIQDIQYTRIISRLRRKEWIEYMMQKNHAQQNEIKKKSDIQEQY